MINFCIILQQELRNIANSYAKILQHILFFFISLAIFYLIAAKDDAIRSNFDHDFAIILFCLIFTIILAYNNFLKQDYEDGTLEQVSLAQPHLEIYVAAKIIALWLTYCLPVVLCLFASYLFLNDIIFAIQFALTTTIATLATSFICAFCNSLALISNDISLIAILILPLTIPTLLISAAALSQSYNNSIFFLFGILIVFAPMSIIASTAIIKIANE